MFAHSTAVGCPLTLISGTIYFPDCQKERDDLKRKNRALQMQVLRLKRKLKGPHQPKTSKKCAEALKKHAAKQVKELQDKLSEQLPDDQLAFVLSQVKNASRKVQGRRWSYKDKAFALTLLHSSPATYKLLRRVFKLPSVKTLRAAMRNMRIYPGYNATILEAMKKKFAHAEPKSKVVVMSLDEMCIKEAVSYDSGSDSVEGMVDGKIANHALGVMISGVADRWKQPIGYFLTSGTVKAQEMKSILLKGIQQLADIGLRVIAVVCDQGTNNQSLFQKELHITPEKPYFDACGQKVYAMYDPPHLIKSIRNNLKNHGFTIDDEIIDWQHIKDFRNADLEQGKALRCAPKLSHKHFNLRLRFGHLKVKLATQVLSRSVAMGMRYMVDAKKVPETALPTANFVENMDVLFNCFNSRGFRSTAKLRNALTDQSGHMEFLKEKLSWLQTIKSNGKRQPPCLSGWVLSIHALLGIWETLKKDFNFTFLLTRRLNQDDVENLFGVIRHKGHNRDNPDSCQFRAAFRQVMVDQVMVQGNNTNCDPDEIDRFLLTLKNVNTAIPDAQPVQSQPSLPVDVPENVRNIMAVCAFPPTDDLEGLNDHQVNILAYIGGYIVKKLQEKARLCQSCSVNIVGKLDNEDARHAFVLQKNDEGARKGLLAPSNALLGVLELLELEYNKVVDVCVSKEQVKASMQASLLTVKFGGLCCKACGVEQMITKLFINIRFHHSLKLYNQTLEQRKESKSRKALKFSHM